MSAADNQDCESFQDLLGVYALDALDPGEAARVRAHLEDCPRCRQEVNQHRESIVLLASAGGPAPDRLWDRISDSIGMKSAPTDAVPPPTVVHPGLSQPGRSHPGRWRRPIQAACIGLAAAVTALVGIQTVRVNDLNHKVNQFAAAARQSSGFPGLEAALVDPSATHLSLVSTTAGAAPLGLLVIRSSGASYLVGSRLPPLAHANTYQMWSIIAGRAVSVGVLGEHPTTVAFHVDPTAPATDYLVTVEPAGGVVAPTTTPVARAST